MIGEALFWVVAQKHSSDHPRWQAINCSILFIDDGEALSLAGGKIVGSLLARKAVKERPGSIPQPEKRVTVSGHQKTLIVTNAKTR